MPNLPTSVATAGKKNGFERVDYFHWKGTLTVLSSSSFNLLFFISRLISPNGYFSSDPSNLCASYCIIWLLALSQTIEREISCDLFFFYFENQVSCTSLGLKLNSNLLDSNINFSSIVVKKETQPQAHQRTSRRRKLAENYFLPSFTFHF